MAEVTRLYSLRSWIEQSYKQVKNSLGWAHYQVRKDLSIRRHWQLVCCAFAFCWWASVDLSEADAPPGVVLDDGAVDTIAAEETAGRGEKERLRLSWPLALRRVRTWLEPWVLLWRYRRAFSDRDPPRELRALLEQVFSGKGLCLYAR